MDVFTNPPPHTYMLYTIFKMPSERDAITAFAVSRREHSFIVVGYATIIQFMLIGLWKLVSSFVLGFFPLGQPNSKNEMTRYVALIAFWNAADPWHASGIMSRYFYKWFRQSNGPERALSALLLLAPFFVTVRGLAVGLLYPTSLMTLENAAPVQPSVVYLPKYPNIGNSTAPQIYSFQRPSLLRSMGSAEAVDLNTKVTSVYVSSKPLRENKTHPQVEINYGFNITGRELGLQKHSRLSYQVTGRCTTEYSWLRPWGATLLGTVDRYFMWNKSTISHMIDVPGSNFTIPGNLGFSAGFEEDDESLNTESSNHKFGFVIRSAGIGSHFPSTDPWYYTELLQGHNLSVWLDAAYRVKSGRPALSCWENINLCFDGACGIKQLIKTLPRGILAPLGERFSPVIVQIALQAGVSSLRVYSGSTNGQLIDASSGFMEKDFQRLVLAAYLWTKETFRNLAINHDSKMGNNLVDPTGRLFQDAAAFIIRTPDVVALRLDLFIIAPVLLCLFWSSYAILLVKYFGQPKEKGEKKGFFIKFY